MRRKTGKLSSSLGFWLTHEEGSRMQSFLNKAWQAVLVVMVLTIAPLAHADDQAKTAAPAASETETATPALWKVEKGDKEGWLFGTMHILPTLDWRSETIDQAIEASDVVVFEIEGDKITPQQAQPMVQKYALLGDGRTLTDVLDAETKAEFDTMVQSLGVPPAAFEPMKPWFAAINVAVIYFQTQGFQPGQGVEMVLLASLRESGKPTAELETFEQQLKFFDDLSEDVAVAMLRSQITDMRENPDLARELLNAWKDGDSEGLNTLLYDSMAEFPEVYESLIVKRNKAWIPQIEGMMDEGKKPFVAVGAGHLVGPDSVNALLEDKGYTVERLQ